MPPKQTPATITLRLTREDRAWLDRESADAGLSLSAFVRWRVFDAGNRPPRSRRQAWGGDVAALTALLAKLGQSQIPNNLNQFVKAAHSGSLMLTPEIEAELLEAFAAIIDMRRLLVTALGLSDGAP